MHLHDCVIYYMNQLTSSGGQHVLAKRVCLIEKKNCRSFIYQKIRNFILLFPVIIHICTCIDRQEWP